MQNLIKKIIRASAGTGKTYRLSLEYIALLLRYKNLGIHYSEILVITFTKKATAEIRDRIFRHLHTLTMDRQTGQELRQNLGAILDSPVTDEQVSYLKQVYHEMLTEKNRVQISTIDAFTYQIFKTVIAPYLGLAEYTMDPQAYKDYLEELYEYILSPAHLPKIRKLFERTGHKNLEGYEKLVRDILNKRWIFPFIEEQSKEPDPAEGADRLDRFYHTFMAVYQEVLPLLAHKCETCLPADVIRKSFYDAVTEGEASTLSEWTLQLENRLQDVEFLQSKADLFIEAEAFWNGTRILNGPKNAEQRQKLGEKLALAGSHLAEYFYQTVFLQEQQELQQVSRLLLDKYDEILFREKRFNYSDVLYHTFKHLYDPELSLIHEDEVSNTFYEVLTTRIRFLLIDEFQDTSILQFKLLLPILKEVTSGQGVKDYGGVIVVGDEKQSIYGWRGGERDFIFRMPDIIPETEQVHLTASYRHSPTVINFINTIFASSYLSQGLAKLNVLWPYHPCTTKKQNDGYVQIWLRNHSPGAEDDNVAGKSDTISEFVQDLIRPLLDQKLIRPNQTAILARRNEDLTRLASVLDEQGMDYVLASSRSIFEHRAIKPLFFFFRYLVRQDVIELAKFLRSDLVRLDGAELKEVLQLHHEHEQKRTEITQPFHRALFERCGHISGIPQIFKLMEDKHDYDLFDYCVKMLDIFKVPTLFPLDTDLKNINFFLEIVAGFSQRFHNYPATPQGLVRFAQDHQEDENFQQAGLEETNAINLLTIHKSKGLEFDSVFLYWEIAPKVYNQQNTLHEYLQYKKDYSAAQDFALAYNMDSILAQSSKKHLSDNNRSKKIIEDLNTFYVAMTRSRQNLFIYCTYNKKEGLEAYQDALNKIKEATASHILFITMIETVKADLHFIKQGANLAIAQTGRLIPAAPEDKLLQASEEEFLPEYWDAERSRYLNRDPEKAAREVFINFKSMYVKKRNTDRGNVVHYYLSLLKNGDSAEKQRAKNRTIRFYGTLLKPVEILTLLNKVDHFLSQHHDSLFSEQWKVFTEQTVYGQDGRELRIDRLLVDEQSKQVVIVDYKTGESFDETQMQDYEQAVRLLPIVRQGGYTVLGKFVEIKIDQA